MILQPHSGACDSLMTSKELGSSTEILIPLAFWCPYLWANRMSPSSEAKNIGSPIRIKLVKSPLGQWNIVSQK